MTTRDEVLAALKAHAAGLTSKELAPLCPAAECDVQVVGRVIAGMRSEGLIHPGSELREGGIIWLFGPAEQEQRELASLPYTPAPGKAARAIAAMRTPKAAERAPDRAPMPVTTPAPARPAVSPEVPVNEKKTVLERAVEALRKHGNQTLEQLAKRIGTTVGTLYVTTPKLKKEHGVAIIEKRGNEPAIYGFPDKAAPKKDALEAGAEIGKRKPAKRINGAHVPTPKKLKPRPDLRIEEGISGAQFAINETGELGIEKDGGTLRLDGAEFARLREFIERTESVWQSAE